MQIDPCELGAGPFAIFVRAKLRASKASSFLKQAGVWSRVFLKQATETARIVGALSIVLVSRLVYDTLCQNSMQNLKSLPTLGAGSTRRSVESMCVFVRVTRASRSRVSTDSDLGNDGECF